MRKPSSLNNSVTIFTVPIHLKLARKMIKWNKTHLSTVLHSNGNFLLNYCCKSRITYIKLLSLVCLFLLIPNTNQLHISLAKTDVFLASGYFVICVLPKLLMNEKLKYDNYETYIKVMLKNVEV